MNVYVPLPFKLEVIKHLLEFMADKPRVPVLIVGDFNMVMNTQMDMFLPGKRLEQSPYTSLYRIFRETGLRDIQREHHPTMQMFSCHSVTDCTPSRIDMAIGNDTLATMVKDCRTTPL